MKKLIFLFFFFSIFLSGQVAISEIYYDTPVIERIEKSSYAHAGEFIELFNYTTTDIDISGWILSDNVSSFKIPNGTIIKSGSFLIFRKNVLGFNHNIDKNDYFFKMFKNIKIPKNPEQKLFSSGNFLLNNYRDEVMLSTNIIKGKKMDKKYIISSVSWDCRDKVSRIKCEQYYYADAVTSNGIDYSKDYYVNSFQKNANEMQLVKQEIRSNSQYKKATPFELGFQFNLVNISEIENWNNILQKNYCSIRWNGSVNNTLNSACNNFIPTIKESIFLINTVSARCFAFDVAGNQTTSYLCKPGLSQAQTQNEETEDLHNKFFLAPNPAQISTTLSWTQDVANLITKIIIVPINGAYEIPVNFSPSNNSVNVSMVTQPSGLYVVKFYINTGEYITKHLMKN